MNAKPLSDVVSPVSAAELQDWLELPTAEAKLTGILQAATEAVITHIQQDLIQRDWRATVTNLCDFRGLTNKPTFNGYPFLELPFSALVSVDAVAVDGASLAIDEYEIDNGTTPGRIHLFGVGWSYNIVIDYVAGIGVDATEIPLAIKTAIKMIAAYIYEHRGACDSAEAVSDSGALVLLKRYRVERL